MLRKIALGLVAAVGLSCCGDSYYRMPEECYAKGIVHDNSGGIDFFVPEDYHLDIVGYTGHMTAFAGGHPNSGNLTDIIFYDSSLCSLPEGFENSAITNSVDTIWLNDPVYFSDSLAGEPERIDFFYSLSGGPDRLLGHEYAHILFQHMLDEMEGNDFKGLASESYEVLDRSRRHYIVDRYSQFLEFMHSMINRPENNRHFERDLLPLASERPDLVCRIRIEVNHWNLDSLKESSGYHDSQLEFFMGLGAINPAYRDILSKERLFPFMESLLETQKRNANAKLDEIESP